MTFKKGVEMNDEEAIEILKEMIDWLNCTYSNIFEKGQKESIDGYVGKYKILKVTNQQKINALNKALLALEKYNKNN